MQAPVAAVPKDAAACTVLAPEKLEPEQVVIRDIVWRSPTQVIVAIGDNLARDPSNVDRKRTGIAIYDITTPDHTPPVSYRIGANDIALAADGKTVFIVGGDRVSTFDLETQCVRDSEPMAIQSAAIDAVHGRVFVLTANGLLRLDGVDLKVALDVPRPRQLQSIGYDPTSDRVMLRLYSTTVELYEGATLAAAGTLTIPGQPTGGPWVRPGAAEAWFIYQVNCVHRKPTPRITMRAGACLDDPKTLGSFLVRYELPSGKLLETIRYANGEETFSEGGASFSGDGKQLMVSSVFDAHLQTIGGPFKTLRQLSRFGKPRYEWGDGESFPIPMELDATGARFAGGFYGYHFRVGDTLTGKTIWRSPQPGSNPY